MNRKTVLEAAETIEFLDGAKALRATIAGGKHELRLYAMTDSETMEDEIGVDQDVAMPLLDRIIEHLESRLKNLGVDR
jgi:hypothetical protein